MATSKDDIDKLKQRYRELAPKVAEREARRKAKRAQLAAYAAEMMRGIIVQAVGTVLGVSLIYFGAVAGGLLEGTRPVEIMTGSLIIIGFVLPLVLSIGFIVRRQEYQLFDIKLRIAAEEIHQKVATGKPLDKYELLLIQNGIVLIGQDDEDERQESVDR